MVTYPLKIRQHIRPDKADLYTAFPLLHTQDMTGTKLFLQTVNDLFERLDLSGNSGIVIGKCPRGKLERLAYSRGDNVVLPQCRLG